jgi:ATP phosphoribosyltransferase
MPKLTIGIPKGSLQNSTSEMMKKAGFNIYVSSRSYYPTIDDEELAAWLVRPQDMSRYVERGILDVGLTGEDWVKENGSDVKMVEELIYAKQRNTKVRWVLAVAEDSQIESVKDLNGKKIATELVNVTKQYLSRNNVQAEVEFSHGATEIKVPQLVDAIVELTETGNSIRANKLRIVDTVIESTTQFIANHAAWKDEWKRHKIENLAILFKGAILACDKVGIKMNVSADCLDRVLKALPALRKPTISTLSEDAGYAIETVMDENVVRGIIPMLKRAGAEGIIEYPLNKVIL